MPVTKVEEILEHALTSPLVPIEWEAETEDETTVVATRQNDEDDEHTGLVKH